MFTLAFLGAEEQRGWWALGRGLNWAGVYTGQGSILYITLKIIPVPFFPLLRILARV